MFKHLLSASILVLLSTGAQASTTYVLNNITYDNTFGTEPGRSATAAARARRWMTVPATSPSRASPGPSTRGGSEYSAMINGTTTLAPTYTPVTSPANALPAGSEILGNTGYCNTVSFASHRPVQHHRRTARATTSRRSAPA